MADRTPNVFVSSTLEDLGPYREAARKAIGKLDWVPLMWEYFAAGGNPPLDTCLERVGEADVLLVIVVHRHGWTPPDQPRGEHKSITRLECERAHGNGKKVIPFFVHEDAGWDRKLDETYRINEAQPPDVLRVAAEVGRNVQELGAFRAWLNPLATHRSFLNPDNLAMEVLHALTEWGKKQGIAATGPTSASIRASYLDWLRRNCETVDLLGLDLKESQNVRLNQVYVPAVTAHKADRPKGINADFMIPAQRDLLLHRLGEDSLYVPGAPGSGKSTFCRWVALAVVSGAVPGHAIEAPEEFQEQLPNSLLGCFPLLFRLREWAGHPKCLTGNGHWKRKELEDALRCWLVATRRCCRIWSQHALSPIQTRRYCWPTVSKSRMRAAGTSRDSPVHCAPLAITRWSMSSHRRARICGALSGDWGWTTDVGWV